MVALTEQIIRGKTRFERLEEVKNLNLWGQELDDVSVLEKLPNVEILSLSVNKISSLRDFRHCMKLQDAGVSPLSCPELLHNALALDEVILHTLSTTSGSNCEHVLPLKACELYLRKNEVSDVSDITYLAHLPDLRVLWLCDNPCADQPNYRSIVAQTLPQLTKLDNEEVTAKEREGTAFKIPVRQLSVPFQVAEPTPNSNGQAVATHIATPHSGQSSSRTSPTPCTAERAQTASQASSSGRSTKNILYAVMALIQELEVEDLLFVRREVEQRLSAAGR